MPGNQAISNVCTLSSDDRHRLAAIIANMLQSHLSHRDAQAVMVKESTHPLAPSAQSNCSVTQTSNQKENDANHRSEIAQNHSRTSSEERLCLSASVEYGASS